MDGKKEAVQRYVDILTNAGFKAVFGDVANKDAVMTVINEFLPEHRRVADIEYLPTEVQGPVTSINKEYQYDFMCRDASGAVFIVEMQRYTEKTWFKRCVCYASRAYDRQTKRGEDYDIAPVYMIGLMGVPIEHPDPEFWKSRFISEYTFREKSCGDLLAETIFIIFAELASFDKRREECITTQDRMLYLLKNVGRLKHRPQWLKNEIYESFFRACEIAAFSEVKRIEYEKDMNDEKRLNGMFAAKFEEGMEKGRQEGRSELLKNLLESGMSVDDVARMTRIDIQEVLRLTGAER